MKLLTKTILLFSLTASLFAGATIRTGYVFLYDTNVSDLFRRVGTNGGNYSLAEKQAANIISLDLRSGNSGATLAKIKEFGWTHVGDSTNAAVKKLIYPSAIQDYVTPSGGMVATNWTRGVGFTGDTSTRFLDTGFIPSANGLTGTNMSCGFFLRDSTAGNISMGAFGGGSSMQPFYYGNLTANWGTKNPAVVYSTNFPAMLTGTTENVTNFNFYIRDYLGSTTSAAGNAPTVSITLNKFNGIGSVSAQPVAIYFIGTSMTSNDVKVISDASIRFNKLIQRANIVANKYTIIGDSTAAGLGLATTQRWTYLVTQALGKTEDNQAISSSMLARVGPLDARNNLGNRWINKFPEQVVMAYGGINDIRNNNTNYTSLFPTSLEETIHYAIDSGYLPTELTVCNACWIDSPAFTNNASFTNGNYTAMTTATNLSFIDSGIYHTYFIDFWSAMTNYSGGAAATVQSDSTHPSITGSIVLSNAWFTQRILR